MVHHDAVKYIINLSGLLVLYSINELAEYKLLIIFLASSGLLLIFV